MNKIETRQWPMWGVVGRGGGLMALAKSNWKAKEIRDEVFNIGHKEPIRMNVTVEWERPEFSKTIAKVGNKFPEGQFTTCATPEISINNLMDKIIRSKVDLQHLKLEVALELIKRYGLMAEYEYNLKTSIIHREI